jgi:hypothetical protein
MAKVRALEMMFHAGSRRRKGEVFDLPDSLVTEARKRFRERNIKPAFELVPEPKGKAAPDTSDIA